MRTGGVLAMVAAAAVAAGCSGSRGALTATFEQDSEVVAELEIDCGMFVQSPDPTDPNADYFDVVGRDYDRALGIVITWVRDMVPGPGTYEDEVGVWFTVLWPNPAPTGPTDQQLPAYGTVTLTRFDPDAGVGGTFDWTVPAVDPIVATGVFDCDRATGSF